MRFGLQAVRRRLQAALRAASCHIRSKRIRGAGDALHPALPAAARCQHFIMVFKVRRTASISVRPYIRHPANQYAVSGANQSSKAVSWVNPHNIWSAQAQCFSNRQVNKIAVCGENAPENTSYGIIAP